MNFHPVATRILISLQLLIGIVGYVNAIEPAKAEAHSGMNRIVNLDESPRAEARTYTAPQRPILQYTEGTGLR
jgi:hypothetical protein